MGRARARQHVGAGISSHTVRSQSSASNLFHWLCTRWSVASVTSDVPLTAAVLRAKNWALAYYDELGPWAFSWSAFTVGRAGRAGSLRLIRCPSFGSRIECDELGCNSSKLTMGSARGRLYYQHSHAQWVGPAGCNVRVPHI